MEDFLGFVENKLHSYAMHVEIWYNKYNDWQIHIWRQGTAKDGGDEEIFQGQHIDLEYLCAKAHVALKDYLTDHEGGY